MTTARRRPGILQLQRLYLETRETRYVEALYRDLVQLGFRILTGRRRDGRYQDRDDVLDLAADICMRLMERGEPVIGSAPSAYMKLALWYKAKRGMEFMDLDEVDKALPDSTPSHDQVVEAVMEESGMDPESEMGALVGQTLQTRTNWHKVLRALPELETRRSFRASMKEVEGCVRESVRRRDAADW